MIKKIFRKKLLKETLQIFRSYKNLKKKQRLNLLGELRLNIEKELFKTKNYNTFEKFLHSYFIKNIDIDKFFKNFNNHLLYEVVDYKFNQKILLGINEGVFKHSVPNLLKKKILDLGIKFSKFNSLRWKIRLIFKLFKSYLKVLISIKLSSKQVLEDSIYIHNNNIINKKFFENFIGDRNSNNFFWLSNKDKIQNIYIPNIDMEDYYFKERKFIKWDNFKFRNFRKALIFFLKLNLNFIFLFILLFTRYWHFSFMFFEIMQCNKENIEKLKKIRKFYFDNNHIFERPLWSLINGISQKKFFVYFVSSNFQFIVINQNDNIPYSGYSSLSWQNYLVWDKRQKQIIEKFNNQKENISITVVNPIPNSSGKIDYFDERIDNNSIILFDVQPYRMSRHIHLGYPNEYYAFENVKKFYEDILNEFRNTNYKIFYKRKRDTKNIDKRYLNYLENLKKNKKIYEIRPDQNIFRLFDSKLKIKSISMPFTGPGYVSKYFNNLTCFYDPSKNIKNINNDEIKLFNNIKELRSFFYNE